MQQFYSPEAGDGSAVSDEVFYGPSLHDPLPPRKSIHGIPLSSCLDIGKKPQPNTPVYILTSLKGFIIMAISVCCAFGFFQVNTEAFYTYSPELTWLDSLQWLSANVTLLYIPLLTYHLVYLQRQEGGEANNIVTWLFLLFVLVCVSFFPTVNTAHQPVSSEFFHGAVMPALFILVCVGAPHVKKLMRG